MRISDWSSDVCSSDLQIYLRYIRRVTDANLMPSDFRETLACLLARELAVPVAQSNSLEEKLEARFRTRLRRARTTDGLEDQAEPMQRGAWAAVRGAMTRANPMNDRKSVVAGKSVSVRGEFGGRRLYK